MDQYCGWDDAERPEDCAQSWNKWTEVCACTENLCNTFAFLRANIDRNNEDSVPEDPHRRTRVPKVQLRHFYCKKIHKCRQIVIRKNIPRDQHSGVVRIFKKFFR